MKKRLSFTILSLVFAAQVHAKNELNDYEIAPALVPEIIGNAVAFYFGEQAHPEIKIQKREYSTVRRTNAVGKTDVEACDRAFQSALIALRDSALDEGANAVVNIRSNYKHNTSSSEVSYRCANGNIMAGVALIGEAVVLESSPINATNEGTSAPQETPVTEAVVETVDVITTEQTTAEAQAPE